MPITIRNEAGAPARASHPTRLARTLRVKHLLLLEHLATTPSLRAAAQALSVSQPAVTKLLAQLEAELGVRLFDRGARGLTPTPFGVVMQRRSIAMLNELGAARREIGAMARGAAGSLRIGVVVGAVPGLLTPALASLLEAHPSIDVFVVAETSANLVPRLLLGELDLVLGQLPAGAADADLAFESISDEPLRLAVHPRHPLRRAARARMLEASLQWPWVVPPAGTPQRARLDAAIDAAGLPAPQRRLETASTLLASSLAREGTHVAVLSADVAAHYAKAGFVVPLPLELSADTGRIGVVTRRAAAPMPVVASLLQRLRAGGPPRGAPASMLLAASACVFSAVCTVLAGPALAAVPDACAGVATAVRSTARSAVRPEVGLAVRPAVRQADPSSRARREPIVECVQNSLGMALVRVPAGEFMMGSDESPDRLARAYPGLERQRFVDLADEAPVHRVRITRSFYMGRHEVTVGQFRRFVEASGYVAESESDGTGGYGYRAGYDPATTARRDNFEGRDPRYSWRDPGFAQTEDDPVVNVTWHDAVAMARWLSAREGVRYRLPTEAQWEYAARAGTRTRSYAGDDPQVLSGIANVYDRDTARVWPQWVDQAATERDGFVFTAPVGRFAPNAFGLHDMIGNVWEWTADWYDADAYRTSPLEDPQGPASGEVRVRRGGSWHTWPFYARVSFRNWNLPDTRYTLVGFRLVREAD